MTTDRRLLDRRRFLTAGLAAVLAACAGQTGGSGDVLAGRTDGTTRSPSSPTSSGSPQEPSAPPGVSPSPTADAAELAAQSPTAGAFPTGIDPHRIEIPAIGVDAPVIDLQLTADSAEVPEDFDDTGWWVQTRQPGEIGPSVIGGHVDSTSGPAVFFRLRDLRPGDEVVVRDEAGESRSFVVSRAPIQVDKYERPAEIFGFGEGRPELRLITCGGDFNPAIGHYDSNIVVFAHDPTHEA